MENAAKALEMAGAILLALLVIGAMVFLYRDLSSTEAQKEENQKKAQTVEFNRAYTSFEKELYGSELLSLVNKIIDYDNKIDLEQSGYTKMTMQLKVKNNYGSFISAGTYTIDNGNNIFKVNLVKVEAIKSKYKGDQYLERLVAALGANNETEFKRLLKEEIKMDTSNSNLNTAKIEVQLYSDYIDFKRMKFKHMETKYDTNGNGRITQMCYEEK